MKKKIIALAYNTKEHIRILHKDKYKNNCIVASYDDEHVKFIYLGKELILSYDEFNIDIDCSESFYRDFICKEILDMTWSQLQNKLEYIARFPGDNDDVTKISKTRLSKPTRLRTTVNDKKVTAAITYGTVTGVRVDGWLLEQRYSVTSSQWQRRII